MKIKVEDGIWYNNKHIPMSYEELVDLLVHYGKSGEEEKWTLEREKCQKALGPHFLPRTDY